MTDGKIGDEASGTRCPICGRRFTCGMEAGETECWCMERPVLPLEPGEGGHCLCPECFERLLRERSSAGA